MRRPFALLLASALVTTSTACTAYPDDFCMGMRNAPRLYIRTAQRGCPTFTPRTGRSPQQDVEGSNYHLSYASVDGCPDGATCTLSMESETHELLDHGGSCRLAYTEKTASGALTCSWDYDKGGTCTWSGASLGSPCDYQFAGE